MNMKAAQINRYGGPEVVVVQDAARPVAKAGQVVVKVKAAAVNPVDWKIRQGYLQQGMPLSLPATLGSDISGVVDEVGEGVTDLAVGDEVYGMGSVWRGGSGAFAEFAAADAAMVSLKPKNIGYVEAAALPMCGPRAWLVIIVLMNVSPGQKVLIHGGSGGLGTFAIQIAKQRGAYVATTVSSHAVEYASDLGADTIIDYTKEEFSDLLHDYDSVFDTVGGKTYADSFAVLRKGGTLVSMLEGPDIARAEEYGVHVLSANAPITSEAFAGLNQLVEQGSIGAHIAKTFPLAQTGEALVYQQTGHPHGKVVITMTE